MRWTPTGDGVQCIHQVNYSRPHVVVFKNCLEIKKRYFCQIYIAGKFIRMAYFFSINDTSTKMPGTQKPLGIKKLKLIKIITDY